MSGCADTQALAGGGVGTQILTGDADTQGPGLLMKVLRVLLAEPPASKYRFWLSSCVESFLRGAQPAHQQFVAQNGLLEMLIKEVSTSGPTTTENDADGEADSKALQMVGFHVIFGRCSTGSPRLIWVYMVDVQSFDLLGETLKFNPQLFQSFNAMMTPQRYLTRCSPVCPKNVFSACWHDFGLISVVCFLRIRQAAMLKVTSENLIDSNVFIRSVGNSTRMIPLSDCLRV